MGKQFTQTRFTEEDFVRFKDHLRKETSLLSHWFQDSVFDNKGRATGIEVEYWLVDQNFLPAPKNKEYTDLLNHPKVVLETSKYNAEINSAPIPLSPTVLSDTHEEIQSIWSLAESGAEKMGLRAILIGSLPTIRDKDLSLDFLSDGNRYRALNTMVMKQRKGKPIHLDIEGRDHLDIFHPDIMLEATATSLQCHFQVEYDKIVPYYNASLAVAPFLVAIAGNSPYLFGQDLWDETRIPVFEQAIRLHCFSGVDGDPISRVGFGNGYVRESLFECFLENLDGYPILMPVNFDEDLNSLTHLRFHNGNIWRWVRPILGVEAGSKPHLRIEQRVPSSGPSLLDMIGNQAFFLGLTTWIAEEIKDLTEKIPFEQLRSHFYAAAKQGLQAKIKWIDNKKWDLQELLLSELLEKARIGLEILQVNPLDIEKYLQDVIVPRVRSGLTGANWQRAYVATHGKDFQGLLTKYYQEQKSGRPVHEWKV